MEIIQIHASKEYSVKIGTSLLSVLGQEVTSLVKGRTAAIISDSNVWPLYGEAVEKSLKSAGFSLHSFIIPAGEKSKNGDTYLHLLNFLAENQLTRSDCLVALGGGVVGDLTGFAAATFLRGISYIQVPTTLLAMVDSSVGGKTAIDLPVGKNLAGAFYHPDLVLCDLNTLDTLSSQTFSDGCAEVIKYGLLFDEQLFSQLEQEGLTFQRESVIARCVELKKNVVAQDEFDTGVRQLLNLGHTIGHAIEKASHYTLSHGMAVAAGICIITRATGNEPLARRLEKIMVSFDLPTTTDYPADQLITAILSDKKRNADQITLVIPATIGCCLRKNIPISQLETLIKAGM